MTGTIQTGDESGKSICEIRRKRSMRRRSAVKTRLKCRNQPVRRENACECQQRKSSLLQLVTKIKLEKWEKQGCRCGVPDCPVESSLETGMEHIKDAFVNQSQNPEDRRRVFYDVLHPTCSVWLHRMVFQNQKFVKRSWKVETLQHGKLQHCQNPTLNPIELGRMMRRIA